MCIFWLMTISLILLRLCKIIYKIININEKIFLLLIFIFSFFNNSLIFADNWEQWQNQNKQNIQKNNSSFWNDLFSWVASYNYNFEFPKWVSGFTPNLWVNYNSAKIDYLNDSWYWFNMWVESIFRSTKKWNDKLYSLDEFAINSNFSNNELQKTWTWNYVWVLNNDTNKYVFENDSWIVVDTNWIKYYFWNTIETKQINPENTKTFRWVLSKKVDVYWNEINYKYIKSDNNIYLSEINYSVYSIKLEYLQKSFSTSSYLYNFKLENHKLLKNVIVSYNSNEIKRYELSYKDVETVFPKLINIKEIAWTKINDNISFTYYDFWIWINLLSQIDNWKWGITSLEYKSSALYKNTTVPFILKTLYKVSYEDNITDLKYSNTYDYYGWNFYFDPTNIYNRWYTWFSKVKIIDDDWSYKMLYFHQSDTDKNNANDTLVWEFEDHISKKWQIYREEVYDENNKLYTTKITKWIKQDKWNNIYFVIPERVTNILWNLSWNHVDTAETFVYDNYWNISKNTKYAEVTVNVLNWDFTDIKSDKKTINYTYAIDSNSLINNKICSDEILDNTWKSVSKNTYNYDWLWNCLVKKWDLTKKSSFLKEENRFISQSFSYYTNWLLKTESDFLWNKTTYIYDDSWLFPKTKTNAKWFIESYIYDYKTQKPTKLVDINGVAYNFLYDNFWNLLQKSVIEPSKNTENILETNIYSLDTIPNYIENKKYLDQNNFIVSRIYFNWFWKEIEIKTSTKYDWKYSTVKTKYDKDWNQIFVTYPIFENNLDYSNIWAWEKWNILTYDTLWRLLTQTNKTWTTKFEYDLLKTTQINQKWVKKDLINDIFWNLVKVVEYNWGEIYTTNYEYNVLNKLSKIIDSKWNIRNFVYDSLLRIILQEDLHNQNNSNFGNVEYIYNDNSHVIQKTTIWWNMLTYEYDELSRLIREYDLWNPTETNEMITKTYIYDVWSNSKWLLSQTINPEYSEEYTYNYLWQKIEDKKIYWNELFVINYNYDLSWNILNITYPDNKQTSYIYLNGYLNKVKYNNTEILSNIEYEANNSQKKYIYANWLSQEDILDYEYGYRITWKKSNIWENYYQNLNYTFDTVWNITNITDISNKWINKNSSYTYDDLNRLISNNLIDWNNQSTNINYGYDSIWNITNNSQIGTYSYVNGTNPYSLTNVWTGTILKYDWNWNVNFETISWINKSYNYNTDGELLTSTVNGSITKYLYDNNWSRVQKETVNGNVMKITIYINNDFEIETQFTKNWSWTIAQQKTSKYIYVWNNKLFTVETKSNKDLLVYNLTDHLWGWNIDINNSGTVLQKSDYNPYGSSRVLERNENYKNNYLFTGKELDDETNLQYFEARYYSPNVGRFYSQDRVFWELWNTKRWLEVLLDPQQLNSYSYARNNPIIYTDPSGEKITLAWILWSIFWIEYTWWSDDDKISQLYKDKNDSQIVADWIMIAWTLWAWATKVVWKKAVWKVVKNSIKWSSVSKPNLSKIDNTILKDIVDLNYRKTATIWNWSTADAIRNEIITWLSTKNKFHSIKWKEQINRIDKWLRSNANEYNPKASDYEISVARNIRNDIYDALYNTKK